ncbi:PEP/pyruvate-binding domain-containing protein [Streptosporangium sandarakinum]
MNTTDPADRVGSGPPTSAPLVLRFADIGAESLPEVGGKAANLGVLAAAGFPVPPGVCVTTEAYRRVAAGAGLEEVLAALDATPPDDVPALGALATRARELVLRAPVPDDVADAVRREARGPVAVRSSATAEDLPDASFAGQQDTYLDVTGADAVLEAVRSCWASLWTDRAVTYRAAHGIDHRSVRLAVVIQEMVRAEAAGVMFTANPVTGRRREAVIDAAPGLGEAVVSGAVNPDRFVVDLATGRITERRPGDRPPAARSAAGGAPRPGTADAGTTAAHDGTTNDGTVGAGTAATGPCLTDAQVTALAALGGRVEAHYGAPQDIEWALDGDGTLWLTQSRPVTTLFPIPRHLPGEEPDGDAGPRVYFSINVAQGVYRPFTPMGASAFRLLSAGAADLLGFPVRDRVAGAPVLAEAAGRLFADVTGVMRSRAGRAVLPRLLDVMETRSARVLRGLAGDPRFSVTRRSVRPALLRAARVVVRHRIPARIAEALVNPPAARRRAERLARELPARFASPPGAASPDRLDRVERTLGSRAIRAMPSFLPAPATGFALLGLARLLLGDRVRPGELQAVLRGLPHNVTTEMDLELWRLAGRIRADGDAAALLLGVPAAELAGRFRDGSLLPAMAEGLRGFLAAYGMRAVAEIDLGVARWSEDPEHVIGVLANYLRLDDPALAPDVLFARGAAEAERMIRTLAARAGLLRGPVVRFALGRARSLAGLRELPKFYMVSVLAAMRAELAAVGADLAGRGLLARPDDVFFLTFPEVRKALTVPGPGPVTRPGSPAVSPVDPAGSPAAAVAERRAEAARELRRRHLPRVLLSDGTEPEAVASAAPADGALTGVPASAGTVTGVARVVLDPVGAHLTPGEILVCPSTDPGWTPLFLTAGGLVMEMGGANSHGAVVAREYGIPAVVGAARATELIATGRRITVDGTSGTVVAS